MQSSRLSWMLRLLLLVLAYATFGRLLHSSEVSDFIWIGTLVFILVKASVLTLLWKPTRNFALLGFQSDLGYSIMVLVLASLAVLAVVYFRAFTYVLVLVAAAILVRVDCLTNGMGNRISFLTLISLPLIGLGVSWVMQWLLPGGEWVVG